MARSASANLGEGSRVRSGKTKSKEAAMEGDSDWATTGTVWRGRWAGGLLQPGDRVQLELKHGPATGALWYTSRS